MNDGVKRCAHGRSQVTLRGDHGYAFDLALDCLPCQTSEFKPLPYRVDDDLRPAAAEPAALEAPVVAEDLPPLIPFPTETPNAPLAACLLGPGLTDDRTQRKQRPICSGVLDYFPDALAEVAFTSWVGNEQHNPGEPLHWARGKSMDQEDALLRHLMERGKVDTDGVRHSGKVAWRALALLQLEIEEARKSR